MFATSIYRRSTSSLYLITVLIIVSVVISLVLARAGHTIQSEIQAEIAPNVGGDIVIEWSQALADADDGLSQDTLIDLITSRWWIISQKVEMNYTLTTTQWPLLVSLWWIDDAYPLYGAFAWLESLDLSVSQDLHDQISISQPLYNTLRTSDGAATLSLQWQQYPVHNIFDTAPGISLGIFDWGRQVVMSLSLATKLDLLVQWSRVSYQTLIRLPGSTSDQIIAIKSNIDAILWQSDWSDIYRVSLLSESEGVFQSVQESLSGYLSLINLIFLLLEVCVLIFLWSRIVHENQSSLQIMRIYGLRNRNIWLQSLLWVLWSIVVWGLLWLGLTYGLTQYLSTLDMLWSASWSIWSYLPILSWVTLLTSGVVFLPLWLGTREWPLALLDQSPLPLSRIITRRQICIGWVVLVSAYGLIVGDISTVLIQLWVVVLLWVIVGWVVWWLHQVLYTLWSRVGWRESRFARWDILRFLTKPGTQSSMITWWCTILMILLSWTVMTYAWLQERLQWLTAGWDAVFVTNVFDEDIAKIDQLSFAIDEIYSVILGRIVSINDLSLQDHLDNKNWTRWERWEGQREQREQRGWFTREFNLTSTPLQDELTAWVPLAQDWDVSVDEEFALSLWLSLGDELVISIAGREFPLTVVNTRSSIRDGLRPFFYFQLLESQFAQAPKTSFFQFVTTPERKDELIAEIASVMWDNVSFLDTWEIIAEVKSYIDRVWLLLSVLFGLMLVYALSAIFSLFRYASIFQKSRFDVYSLLWASQDTISSLKSWYILIYLIISVVIALLSFIAFVLLFGSSQVLTVSTEVLWWWVGIVSLVAVLVWLWGRVR